MLPKEENEMLTQVGPGTPAGELLRCYWYPAAVARLIMEPLNRIVAAGALERFHPDLLNYHMDYVPCYRTPAGTGRAMDFMRWR